MVESLSDSIRYCSSHGSLAVQQILGCQHALSPSAAGEARGGHCQQNDLWHSS